MIATQPSCADIYESGLLPVEQTLKKISASLTTITDFQLITIEKGGHNNLQLMESEKFWNGIDIFVNKQTP